ncbi:MAG: sensor histidine kinase [Anaerolineales bacterium]|nr:sensor histidine kinase [Anaerolineales bacterium]
MDSEAPSPLETLLEEARLELESTQRELRDIKLTLHQSRAELDKLTQRNAQIAAHLRQMQANLENMPRAEIKSAYEAAQDAQQRLFAMRGQVERLQADQQHLERLADYLKKTIATLEELAASVQPGQSGAGDKPLIARIVEAQETERQKLSRQIHDGPAQALSNFVLQSEIAMRLFERDPALARAELANMKTAAATALQKIRDFIFDLRPMMLDDLGLVPTVKRYVDAFKDKSGIPTTLTITGTERRLESVREVMIFRGLQELLSNVRNHAQATEVHVTLDTDDVRVRAIVEDNGRGFNPEILADSKQKTVGLSALKERIELLGGALELDSQPGQGTRVVMDVPVGEPV